MTELNKDAARRAEIIGLDPSEKSFGGIQRFEGLTGEQLKQLVDEGFAELDDVQNCAPTLGAFLDFALAHPETVTLHGYAVSPERDDYRVSIEGLDATCRFQNELAEVVQFVNGADELDVSDDGVHVYAWWD